LVHWRIRQDECSPVTTDIAIRAKNLSKRYQIGAGASYLTLRDALTRALAVPFRRKTAGSSADSVIHALDDVSFEIQRGDVVGIVGRNGAGKSTLLKVLSRITRPTSGYAEVHGRVGSLLEVGTGFHPELTGRENLYLSGAVLGMKKAETRRKFDEIVAFAEIEKFLDTPVKHYSSGMYMRLAFSVAAHLEPEILLVDEVLAVGDITFQQKCLNHMRKLTDTGMTILLVSHNLAAIQSSCRRALWMHNGRISTSGEPIQVIAAYRDSLKRRAVVDDGDAAVTPESASRSGQGISIVGFEMFGEDGTPRREFRFGEAIRVRIDLSVTRSIENPLIHFGISRGDGVPICGFNNWYDNFKVGIAMGRCSMEGWLPPLRLIPDYYEAHVLVWLWGGGHLQGDLAGSRPLASRRFGDFRITGPALNSHDGVFQVPALRWSFRKGDQEITFCDITEVSIEQAFETESRPDAPSLEPLRARPEMS
jgi:lipopolysaccharide transport system ATP-binding protein